MIKVDNLSYTYKDGAAPAVSEITFGVEAGEIFGFLGPSGAGKSTTQKILTGLLQGYSGQAIVMGQDLNSRTSSYFENIGISFEFPNIYIKLTGLENLMFFASMYSGRTASPMKLLQMVGLEKDAHKRAEAYSKGMRMRLNFARAFLCRPKLVFLDEPTSGQDPNNARNIKNIILKKRDEGLTVFLTTHDMTVAAELCDRVAFIVNGKLCVVDSPGNLMIEHGSRTVRVEYEINERLKKEDFPLDRIGSDENFLHLIKTHPIRTIHSLEATLEDIFIKTTGYSLKAKP